MVLVKRYTTAVHLHSSLLHVDFGFGKGSLFLAFSGLQPGVDVHFV